MSRALITESYLTDIADAIRAKNGSSDTYTPPQMAAAIAAIPTGGDVDVEALNVTENGTYTAPSGKAYSPVTVNVYGGGGSVLRPDYQGLAWSYLALNGNYYSNNAEKRYYSSYFNVRANKQYAIFIGSVQSDRYRAHFYSGKSYADFELYVNSSHENAIVYTCTDNITGRTELSGDSLNLRFIITPNTDGEIVIVTSNTSVNAPAYCVELI